MSSSSEGGEGGKATEGLTTFFFDWRVARALNVVMSRMYASVPIFAMHSAVLCRKWKLMIFLSNAKSDKIWLTSRNIKYLKLYFYKI